MDGRRGGETAAEDGSYRAGGLGRGHHDRRDAQDAGGGAKAERYRPHTPEREITEDVGFPAEHENTEDAGFPPGEETVDPPGGGGVGEEGDAGLFRIFPVGGKQGGGGREEG